MAVSLMRRGFGFVVIEGGDRFIDWGIKVVTSEKMNAENVKRLLKHNQPRALVLKKYASRKNCRSARIWRVHTEIAGLGVKFNVAVREITREQVTRFIFGNERGSKDALASRLADRFPQELGFWLPSKRRIWDGEDYRMALFDAVALALTFVAVSEVRPLNKPIVMNDEFHT